MIGAVKWYNPVRGFGFIEPEGGGPDVFVHVRDIERAGMDNLNEGQRIAFEVGKDHHGRRAAVRLRKVG